MAFQPHSYTITQRALIAALTKGTFYRQEILRLLSFNGRSIAPAMGIDIIQLARVCLALEKRERFFDILYFPLALSCVLIIAPGRPIDILISFIILLVIVIVGLVKRYQENFVIYRAFCDGNYSNYLTDQSYAKKLHAAVIDSTDAETNLVVYDGYFPFSFSGLASQRINFTIDISRAEVRAQKPKAIQLVELYNAISLALIKEQPNALTITECLVVHGTDLNHRPELMISPVCPKFHLSSSDLQSWNNSLNHSARYYLWTRADLYDEQISVSHFVNLSLRGSALSVEITQCLMGPIDNESWLDWRADLIGIEHIRWSLQHLYIGPMEALITLISWFVSCLTLVPRKLWEAANGGREQVLKRQIVRAPNWNFGAKTSMRRFMSANSFQRYFQQIDAEAARKTLERATLDALIDILIDKGVDVTALREGRTTIMNSGIFVQGGGVSAQNIAVGKDARAKFKTIATGEPPMSARDR